MRLTLSEICTLLYFKVVLGRYVWSMQSQFREVVRPSLREASPGWPSLSLLSATKNN